MAILNKVKGLRPMTTPHRVESHPVAETVYRFCPVVMAAGFITRADAATDVPYGVALGYAEAGDSVQICVDPEMLYSAIADDDTVGGNLYLNIGSYMSGGTSAATGDADTLISNFVLDESAISTAYKVGGTTPYYVVDVDEIVGNSAATAGNARILVRIARPDHIV